MIQVGDEQIYRLRDYAPSQRVRILAIDTRKKNPRYDVEFIDGENAGQQENIPSGRLRGPWSGVSEYDELMANWERLAAHELTDPEESAVETVFRLLLPPEAATWEWSPIRWMTEIHDPDALEPLIGIPVAKVLEQVDSFAHEGVTMVSPEGTLLIAEFACRVNPMPVLDWVIEEEEDYRKKTKRGEAFTTRDNRTATSDPQWEYRWYLERGRPLHELLRGWCGQRAVSMQERLAAAEAEVQRLNSLIARLIDQMKEHGNKLFADVIEQVHDEERITAANYRPVVDRPLKPSEMPVRYETAPRRWGYSRW